MSGADQPPQPLHALKGAAASVMLALVFHGGTLSARDLQGATGYSDKPVRRGLAVLENLGFVRFSRHEQRWTVVDGAPLLAALLEALQELAAVEKRPGAGQSAADQTAEKGTASPADPPAGAADGDLSTAAGPDAPQPGGISTAPGQLSTTVKPEKQPSTLTTTARTAEKGKRKQKSKAAEEATSAQRREKQHRRLEISRWLVRAGVGSGSQKMRSLLDADLDPDYVKAHVLEKIYHDLHPDESERPWSAGLLIRRLEDRDPAPPMRCEKCWQAVTNGRCWCDYKDAY